MARVSALAEIKTSETTHESERENLDPASLGTEPSDRITELVVRERLRDRVGAGERLLKVVESIRNSNVFHDVALVENVGSRRGHDDVDLVFGVNREVLARVDGDELAPLLGRESLVTHLLEESDDVCAGEVQARARVDVGSASDKGSREERRREELSSSSLGALFVDNLDRFDAVVCVVELSVRPSDSHKERRDSHERLGAVFGEHGHDHVDNEVELRRIGGSDIDEDVLRVEGDLSVVRIDLRPSHTVLDTT